MESKAGAQPSGSTSPTTSARGSSSTASNPTRRAKLVGVEGEIGSPAQWLQSGRCTRLPSAVDVGDTTTHDVRSLVAVVQGLLVHEHLAGLYGVDLDERQRQAVHLRSVSEILAEVRRSNPAPLGVSRDPQERVAANCRQFTVLLVALLRSRGTPARARCGFSNYFGTGRWEDHWVAEVSDGSTSWTLVDAQVDQVQRTALGVDVDPLHVPRDRFFVAGEAWRRCRDGSDDPERYGLTSLGESGLWWVGANLMRDAWAVEGTETLPWDSWGSMPGPDDEIDPGLAADLDRLADCTILPDTRAAAAARSRLLSAPAFALGGWVHNDLLDRDEPLPGAP